MKFSGKIKKWVVVFILFFPIFMNTQQKMKIRIAEIEVFSQYLENYLVKAKNIGQISMEKEKGVICIFPMQLQENPTQIRVVEIYVDEKAYQQHLQTAHFQEYKTSTLQMIKSLKLLEMNALNEQTLSEIFKKLPLCNDEIL